MLVCLLLGFSYLSAFLDEAMGCRHQDCRPRVVLRLGMVINTLAKLAERVFWMPVFNVRASMLEMGSHKK